MVVLASARPDLAAVTSVKSMGMAVTMQEDMAEHRLHPIGLPWLSASADCVASGGDEMSVLRCKKQWEIEERDVTTTTKRTCYCCRRHQALLAAVDFCIAGVRTGRPCLFISHMVETLRLALRVLLSSHVLQSF